jgi:hypothetical protein
MVSGRGDPTRTNPDDGGNEMSGDLDNCKALLASVSDDLATMGKHKAGTEWHTDRVREAEWLHRTIERLERARRERAQLN